MTEEYTKQPIIEKNIKEELDENKNRYSFTQKLNAFVYHIGMTVFGPMLCKEKHDEYFEYFDELCKQQNIT